jgi:hypothetical protein
MPSRTLPWILSIALVGCSVTVTRPDQDNFEIDASNRDIEGFIRALSTKLETSADRTAVNFHDADPGELFRLDSKGITIIIESLPDDRCNPNAPMHTTYNRRRYAADLVYRTSSQPIRAHAKQTLIDSAREARVAIQPFKEC